MSSSSATLPEELRGLLARLQQRIRRYVLLEGLALALLILGAVFWLSLGLDWGYFRLQRAELPVWVRFLVEVGALSLAVGVAVIWGLARAYRAVQQRTLALVLERRFPELNDRLITAVELNQNEQMPPLTRAMLARTVEEVRGISQQLDLNQVFDRQPLYRTGISAGVALISVLVFAVAFTDVFQLWFRRNVLLANEAWHRETALRVVAISQPGDREVEFVAGVYKHPRGSDLVLRASVVTGRKAPEQVQIRYRFVDTSTRGRAYFARFGREEFQHTLTNITSSFEFQLLAGDAERLPYYVEVVDPPKIDSLQLNSLFPAYTGLNARDEDTDKVIRTAKPVRGTRIAVPAGTDFLLHAETNKPLVGVSIQTEKYDVELHAQTAKVTWFEQSAAGTSGTTAELTINEAWLAPDRRHFSIPFVIGQPAAAQGTATTPLPLPPEAVLKITLHDADDIRSQEPQRVTISSITDEPPRIESQLKGIGSSITRKAVIPFTGVISDDYGVAGAHFDYRVDENAPADPRNLSLPATLPREFKLETSAQQPSIKFEVLPLELKLGQKLTVAIQARDADNLHGPHLTTGERYTFQIVGDEELLSQLYARELNLRLRFEQILTEIKRAQSELVAAQPRLTDWEALHKAPATTGDTTQSITRMQELMAIVQTATERGLYGIRKNHNETQAIEQSFGDIREEMVNNAVDTPASLGRIDDKLLRPLQTINTQDFPEIDQQLGLLKLALEKQTQIGDRLESVFPLLDRLVRRIEAILVEMRRLETYKELLERLKVIKTLQEELKRKTEAENKRGLLDKLK